MFFLLQVYDTDEGRFLYSIDHFNEIRSMDVSSDDQLLATTSFHFDNEVILDYIILLYTEITIANSTRHDAQEKQCAILHLIRLGFN